MGKTIVLAIVLLALAGGTLACGNGPAPTTPPASTPSPTPPPVLAPGWEDVTVRVLCADVEQSYPQAEGKSPEPILEAVQRMLAGTGLEIVTDDLACDAMLTITLTGVALGEDYTGGQYCYSGAQVDGELTLSVADRAPLTLAIGETYSPPDIVLPCPEGAADAPFERAWTTALLQALVQVWGPQVAISALAYEGDEELWMRQGAAGVLGEIGPGAIGAVPALVQALEDEYSSVGRAAAAALGQMGAGAVPALTHALGDEDDSVRAHAAWALAAMGPEAADAVPALMRALEDEASPVRTQAAFALKAVGGEAGDAIPALVEALEDEDAGVRLAAASALKTIAGADLGEDADVWREWWQAQQSAGGQ
jgi:hypothetical protein